MKNRGFSPPFEMKQIFPDASRPEVSALRSNSRNSRTKIKRLSPTPLQTHQLRGVRSTLLILAGAPSYQNLGNPCGFLASKTLNNDIFVVLIAILSYKSYQNLGIPGDLLSLFAIDRIAISSDHSD